MKNKPWIPQKVCRTCVEFLRLWTNKKLHSFRYKTAMIWNEPMNHYEYCYFCLVNITGINRKNQTKWKYLFIQSAHRRVLTPKSTHELQSGTLQEKPEDLETKNDSSDSDPGTLKPFNQDDLNKLIRDMGLSKSAS
ncbi:unnamed protein product [Psylliodes chrysocephalus]|uniref:Uncharacterized protein n=1 Tax=Psylliodes chrysocephalus TaxID=3402493 RepID=A0A9P0D5Y4_9CUCU|nr:unnamed protein product [Psylliodes chrysocephala]